MCPIHGGHQAICWGGHKGKTYKDLLKSSYSKQETIKINTFTNRNECCNFIHPKKETNLVVKDFQGRTNQILVWGGDLEKARSRNFVIWHGHSFQQAEIWQNQGRRVGNTILWCSNCQKRWKQTQKDHLPHAELEKRKYWAKLNHYVCLLPSKAVSWTRFSHSVTQSCLTLCNPMDRSTPGLPVHHQLPEFTQTLHWVGDAIQPSHPLSSPSPPAFNLSQYQGLFQWVSSLHQVAKILEFQLQHQSFQWIFKTDFL